MRSEGRSLTGDSSTPTVRLSKGACFLSTTERQLTVCWAAQQLFQLPPNLTISLPAAGVPFLRFCRRYYRTRALERLSCVRVVGSKNFEN